MVQSFWKSLVRTRRGRRIRLLLVVVAAGLAAWFVQRGGPPLSPVERALVGEWGRAETDPGFSFATPARGPMKRPWLVQEFAGDRSYRQWIVSADDTGHCFLHVQGRWRVVGNAIRCEEQPPGARRVLEDIGTQIERQTGLPLAPSSSYLSATRDIPFELVGTDELKLNFPKQLRPFWVRLPGSFKEQPRLSVKRAGAAGMASP